MRRIAVIFGSDSDLPQCQTGLEYLAKMAEEGRVKVVEVITASIHRNTEFVLEKLRSLVGKVDALIVGAGWANALTGITDAFLRNTLRDDRIVVVGVAFEDNHGPNFTQTAILSIVHTPGTQVVFTDLLSSLDRFIGKNGFSLACQSAVEGELPVITLKDPKPPITRTLEETLKAAQG